MARLPQDRTGRSPEAGREGGESSRRTIGAQKSVNIRRQRLFVLKHIPTNTNLYNIQRRYDHSPCDSLKPFSIGICKWPRPETGTSTDRRTPSKSDYFQRSPGVARLHQERNDRGPEVGQSQELARHCWRPKIKPLLIIKRLPTSASLHNIQRRYHHHSPCDSLRPFSIDIHDWPGPEIRSSSSRPD